MDAISTGLHLHLFMQFADRIQLSGLAQSINVIHSLFLTRPPPDSTLVKSPTFYIFKMFIPHHTANAKYVPNRLTSETINGNCTTMPVVSAGASVDSLGNLNASFCNIDLTNTRTVRVTINPRSTVLR